MQIEMEQFGLHWGIHDLSASQFSAWSGDDQDEVAIIFDPVGDAYAVDLLAKMRVRGGGAPVVKTHTVVPLAETRFHKLTSLRFD